jgi:hypothetical protein
MRLTSRKMHPLAYLASEWIVNLCEDFAFSQRYRLEMVPKGAFGAKDSWPR